ncbi:MAG: hypothetical protein H6745_28355 [Deltaproteobacteria bacterium]|nr:hypothetical protein [Deltaproteobacteria bacterium]
MPLRGSRAARAGVLAALALTLLASGGCPPVDGDPLDVEADGAKADAADTADAGDALDFDYLPPQDTAPAKDRCRVVYQIATRWEGDSGYQTFATVDYQGGPLQAWVVKLTYPVVTAVSGAWTSNGIFVGEPENHGTEVVVAFRPPDYIGLLGEDFTRYQFAANVFGNPNVAIPYVADLNDVECELVITEATPEE